MISGILAFSKNVSSTTWVRVLIILQLMLMMIHFSPELCNNGDNARYFLLGKALSSGEGYRQIHLSGSPPEGTYPLGFPLLLAAFQFISSTPLFSKAVFTLLAAAVTLLCCLVFRNYERRLLIPLLLLVATSGLIGDYSTILMSEIPYLFACLLSLYLLNRSRQSPESKRLFWIAIIVSVLPIHIRSIGIAFTAAWVVDSLLGKRYRYAVAHVTIVMATLVITSSSGGENAYAVSPFLKNPYDPEMGGITAQGMLERIVRNLHIHFAVLLPKSVLPLNFSVPRALLTLFSLALSSLFIIGWIRNLFSPKRFIGLYLGAYGTILLLWFLPNDRRMVVLLPFIYYLILSGLLWIIHTFRPSVAHGFFSALRANDHAPEPARLRLGRIAVWSLVLLVVAGNIHYHLTLDNPAERTTRDWVNFYSCADWVRNNTPADAVVMNRKQELFYQRSQRKGCMYPYTHSVEKIIAYMRETGVTHIVYDSFFWTGTTHKYLYPVLRSHPELFRVVYRLQNPDTFVLEFLGNR